MPANGSRITGVYYDLSCTEDHGVTTNDEWEVSPRLLIDEINVHKIKMSSKSCFEATYRVRRTQSNGDIQV